MFSYIFTFLRPLCIILIKKLHNFNFVHCFVGMDLLHDLSTYISICHPIWMMCNLAPLQMEFTLPCSFIYTVRFDTVHSNVPVVQAQSQFRCPLQNPLGYDNPYVQNNYPTNKILVTLINLLLPPPPRPGLFASIYRAK